MLCNIYRAGDDRLVSRDNPGRGEVWPPALPAFLPPSSPTSHLLPFPSQSSQGVRTDPHLTSAQPAQQYHYNHL